MNPHLDTIKKTRSGGKRKRGIGSARLYTFAKLQAMDEKSFEQFIKTCSDKSRQDNMARYPSAYNPYRNKSDDQVARETLLVEMPDPDSPTSYKNSAQDIADCNQATQADRNKAAHVMTLEQIRRHTANTCSESEKNIYEAIFGRSMDTTLLDILGNLPFYNGWHHGKSLSLESLNLD